jgi:hypothetical protein
MYIGLKLRPTTLTSGFDLFQHSLLPKEKGQEVNLPARLTSEINNGGAQFKI